MSIDRPLESSPATPLDYAPAAPVLRRKWVRRLIAYTLLPAMGWAAWTWGPAAWMRTRVMYYQHQCLTYDAPADQVVFDSDPARAAELAKDSHYVLSRGCAVRTSPAALDAMPTLGWAGNATYHVYPPGGVGPAMIFLHELRTPGGVRALVSLQRAAGKDLSSYFIAGYDVFVDVITPATWRTPPVNGPMFGAFSVLESAGTPPAVRIFAGQLDPADPAHFTVRYLEGTTEKIVDGRLTENGSLILSQR